MGSDRHYKGKLLRIQIKHASHKKDGTYNIPFRSVRVVKDGYINKYYDKDQIDFVATIINGAIYLFEPCGKGEIIVRDGFDGKIHKNMNILSDYNIDKVLNSINQI